jgi:hypothetical protein
MRLVAAWTPEAEVRAWETIGKSIEALGKLEGAGQDSEVATEAEAVST